MTDGQIAFIGFVNYRWTANNNDAVKEETNEYFTPGVYIGCLGRSCNV